MKVESFKQGGDNERKNVVWTAARKGLGGKAPLRFENSNLYGGSVLTQLKRAQLSINTIARGHRVE